MINRGGENVYCVEVENALAAHPVVGEVAVVGVADSMMGEKVGAVVVPLPGRELDPHELVVFARERLADFKDPEFLAARTVETVRGPVDTAELGATLMHEHVFIRQMLVDTRRRYFE